MTYETHRALLNKERARQQRRQKQIVIGCLVAVLTTGIVSACITKNSIEPVTTYIEVPVELIKEVPVEVEVPAEPEILYVPVAAEDSTTFALTAEERDLVTRVVIAEAGAATLQDMVGIAQVIRDRAEHGRTDLYGGPTLTGVLSNGHAVPYQGDISVFPLASKAVEIVFDAGVRLFDETACIYFTPDKSDPNEVEILRQYKYVGETPCFEFHSDTLKEDG